MQNPAPSPSANNKIYGRDDGLGDEGPEAAVSWPAIIGGVFASVALSLILIGFGSGLGFASMSMGPHEMNAKHFTWMAAAWLIVVQWISSGLGGYLTGRLRTKWTGVHSHEVFFRDTAHGFITWSVTTVVATLLIFSVASSAMHVHGAHPMNGAPMAGAAGPESYYIDKLFRKDAPDTEAYDSAKVEATPILMHAMKDGEMSEGDKNYLAQLVVSHTGEDETTAQRKVAETVTQMHEDAQQAEKAAASFSIYTFLSMLIGAFIACVAAALGGQRRDTPYPHEL